jgi:hypothetical protein
MSREKAASPRVCGRLPVWYHTGPEKDNAVCCEAIELHSHWFFGERARVAWQVWTGVGGENRLGAAGRGHLLE